MTYRVTTRSNDGTEIATFRNVREARDHAAQIIDLYDDEGIRCRGNVDRDTTIKIVDSFARETVAIIRIEGIN